MDYHIPSRTEARARRDQEQRGYLFPLPQTGGYAHVRKLSLAELTAVAGLPTSMQTAVLRVFRDVAAEDGAGPLTWQSLARNQKRQREMADAICCAGFIRPRLVLNESDLDGTDDCWLIDDLHIEERIAYFNLCVAGGRDDTLVPFPGPDAEAGVGGLATVPAGETADAAI